MLRGGITVENPPAEATPDFAYEPCKVSEEAVIGECQREEETGLTLDVAFLFLAVVLV